MWLNLHLHKRLDFNLFTQRFPRDIAENHVLSEDDRHGPTHFVGHLVMQEVSTDR
jgi:hypothetical protein